MTSAATQTLWVLGIDSGGTSLVARWLEVQLPTQGTWVRSLVLELRSHTSGPLATLVAMRQLSPCSATKEATAVRSPCTATREAPLFTVTRESPCRKEELNKDPDKKENKNKNHSLGNNWKKKKELTLEQITCLLQICRGGAGVSRVPGSWKAAPPSPSTDLCSPDNGYGQPRTFPSEDFISRAYRYLFSTPLGS